ncbi:hypothetical protein RI367_003715 [Sorochytrium milnesiophthora]
MARCDSLHHPPSQPAPADAAAAAAAPPSTLPPVVALVGHCSHDALILHSGDVRETLGGSVAYVCSILSSISAIHFPTSSAPRAPSGKPSSAIDNTPSAIHIVPISKVGSDFRYHAALQWHPVFAPPCQHQPPAATTRFVCDASAATILSSAAVGNGDSDEAVLDRAEFVETICEPISPADIMTCLPTAQDHRRQLDIACALGIVNEIPLETLQLLRQQFRLVVADIQGFIRHFPLPATPPAIGRRIPVHYRPLDPTILHCVDFLKVSRAELQYVDIPAALQLNTTLLITQGGEQPGCQVLGRSVDTFIAGFHVPADRRIDSTGCGDAFLAGFVLGLTLGRPLEICAAMGNYFGALTIQAVGIPNIPASLADRALDPTFFLQARQAPLLPTP